MKRIFNPDKAAQTLGIPWKNWENTDCETGEVEEIIESTFLFEIVSDNLKIILHYSQLQPDEILIEVWFKDKLKQVIKFSNLTAVYYDEQEKKIDFEGRNNDQISLIEFFNTGDFRVYSGLVLKDYTLH